MSLILCWSEDSRNLARSWKTHEVRRRLTQCWHSMEQRRRTYIPYVTLDFVLREMQILNMQLIQVSTVLGQSLRQRSYSGLHVSVKECVTAWQSFMDVYVVGYDLEQNIMKFKANSSSPRPLRNQGWSRAKTRHFSMGWFIRSSPLSPIQFESEADLFDNSPYDPLRTAVQSPMVWIVNKIIHPACNFRSSLRRLRYIRVYPAVGTPLCYFRNRTVSRWMKWSILHQYFCYFKGTNVCVVWKYPRSTPWCSRNGTGRFSKDDATSNKNAKACGKDWTRLPMLNFPLSLAKSVLRSARAVVTFVSLSLPNPPTMC